MDSRNFRPDPMRGFRLRNFIGATGLLLFVIVFSSMAVFRFVTNDHKVISNDLHFQPSTPTQGSLSPIHQTERTSANQVILVTVLDPRASDASISGYSWDHNQWKVTLGPFDGTVGEYGITLHPTELDNHTPIGQYNITTLFGSADDPGALFAYRKTTSNDYWVDDVASPFYNTWQTGPSDDRWESAEDLGGYVYAIAFDFNQNPVVRNGNSAIFLHSSDDPSAGCITTSESSMRSIMRWLDPKQKPIIDIGTRTVPVDHA